MKNILKLIAILVTCGVLAAVVLRVVGIIEQKTELQTVIEDTE